MGEVFLVKGIKPRKLRIDAVRLELLNALRAEGKVNVKLLEQTMFGWRGRKPKMEALIGLTRTDVTLLVGPTGATKAVEKWTRSDEGTPPHTIRAKRKPYLVFRIGYNPGSRPGVLRSRRSYYVGNHWRRAKTVRHPGTQARGWSELVTKRRKRPYQRRMMTALNRGLVKGGWK